MSTNNSTEKVVEKLARKSSGGLADELLRDHLPPPPPPPPARKEYATDGGYTPGWSSGGDPFAAFDRAAGRPPVGTPREFKSTPGEVVQVGGYELRRKPLWPNDSLALGDRYKARPSRPPQRLTQSDWEALAETPVKKGMDFDSWARECCFEPFVKDHDPDYPAVARLYLAKKAEAHRGSGGSQ